MINMIKSLIFITMITTVHGQVFTSEEISQAIKDQLQTQLTIAGDFELILSNGKMKWEGEALEVEKVIVTDQDRQFEAWLKGPSQVKITGRIQPLIEIPVLTRPISPGEIVADSDLDWKKIPSNRLTPNMFRQISDVIGKTSPSRVLQPGQPLLRTDLKAPILVKKGDSVAISYKIPGMSVSGMAIALQDGAKGETIRFQAPSSKKEIRARILDQSRAEITPMEF
jgi:flagellar basal body P-ring formation protein FlgA